MEKVVITGCLGFIGSYVTEKFLCDSLGIEQMCRRRFQVLGIDKITYAANTELIDRFNRYPNFTLLKADIATLDYLPDCDIVINMAAWIVTGKPIY